MCLHWVPRHVFGGGGGGDAYAQSSAGEAEATGKVPSEGTSQRQVEVEVGRLERWLDNPNDPEFSQDGTEIDGLELQRTPVEEGPMDESVSEPPHTSSPVSDKDRDAAGFYDDTRVGRNPTFELDIGVQQESGDGGGDGALPGDDGRSKGEGSAGEGNGNRGGAADGTGGDGDGLGDTDGPGSQVGSGDGSGDGNSRGDGSANGPGNGSPGGDGPVQTRRDYIPYVTGLIVDARQLDFLPSMSMRLFDPDGNQVYTTPSTNRQLNASQVAINGTALFVTDEAQARELVNRIGERPHTVMAQRTQGYDLVISNEDAWELRNQNQRDRFLENYAVVVIWKPRN